MALNIVSVGADKKALQSFLEVPYRIYKDDANYVYPLISEMKHFHDKKKNPFYSHADSELWLVERNGQIIGRIGACVDRYNNEHWNEKTGWFGFYEVDDDAEAAALLLETAQSWLAERDMEIMRGPGCFTSNHDWYGLQVAGEFSRPVIGMPYNPRYYEQHLENFGLAGAKDLFAWNIVTKSADNPEQRMLGERCIVGFNSGPPFTPSLYNNNVQIFQNKDTAVIMTEMIHDARIVRLGDKPELSDEIFEESLGVISVSGIIEGIFFKTESPYPVSKSF